MRLWAAALLAGLTAFAATADPGPTTNASRPSGIVTYAIPGIGSYTYDGAGNITSIGDAEAKDLFTYDNFGRLQTAAVRNAPGQTYTYDQWGNILTITTAGDSVVQKFGVKRETNQITEAVDPSGQPNNVVGVYDSRGNLTSYSSGSFVYDGLEMVKEATVDGVRRFHVYSPSDERVVTVKRIGNAPAGSEWTIRDPNGRVLRRLTETSGTLAWTEDYVYRGSQLLAAAVPGPERVRHFHVDHLGTPRLVTGNGGVELARHDYQPYGRELASSSVDGEKAKFTGHERDAESLDYMHARYYDPFMGRFLSVDPTWASADVGKPQSWNRYSYVLNNPVNYTDPDGRCTAAVIDCVIEGGSVGGVPGAVIGGVAGVGILVIGHIEVGGKSIGRHLGNFMLSGGGGSGEMAAETSVQNWAAKQAEEAEPAELPARDSTGKIHGELPTPADLREHSTEDLKQFQEELKGSVGKRIEVTSQLGPDKAHGERQAAEQRLIKQIDKIVTERGSE